MNMNNSLAMNCEISNAPSARATIESCTQEMYDALLALGAEIDMLKKDLSPVLHAVNDKEQKPGVPLGIVQGQQPEAIEKLGGLKTSIDTYRIRLESIRLRHVVA